MDFETQVIDQLNTIDEKLDAVIEWKASTQPICDRHTEQINTHNGKLFGNGGRGIERRLDTVESTHKTFKKIWVALVTAFLIGMGGLALGALAMRHTTGQAQITAEP